MCTDNSLQVDFVAKTGKITKNEALGFLRGQK
jgi:hypothetical protein